MANGTAVSAPSAAMISDQALAAACTPQAMQKVASALGEGVTVKAIPNGATVPGGARFHASAGESPAFCQAVGSFVTNPATGKTANFMATFPANWNGKYMQVGCSGHCGQFFVSDPAMPTIVITSQGKPMDAINRGYAIFATDEGHTGLAGGTWATKGPGQIDQDAIDDLYYRADEVLSKLGKNFTKAFYGTLRNRPQTIAYSYFNGCSGGGRDALVAATRFPQAFDGIISGSPYNAAGAAFQFAGVPVAALRSPGAVITAELAALIPPIVAAQCDKLDGVEDGLIQNPAACNFVPERDLPICKPGESGGKCFTKEQAETVSTLISAVTDENGEIVQPGLSVSDMQGMSFKTPKRPDDLAALEPFPGSDNGDVAGNGYWPLADAMLKVFVHGNDPNFHSRSVVSFARGGNGQVTNYHIVVPSSEVALLRRKAQTGIGHFVEGFDPLMRSKTRLMIWHNLSDNVLTPYASTNLYNKLAARHGGYARLQQSVRLFGLPGTPHCSMGGAGPNSFDAMGAMEKWVEQGQAPEALWATNYAVNGFGVKQFDKAPGRTMPLCKYPEMARYKGTGDVNDGHNWECPANDRRMLGVGESGRQAGVTIPRT
ncbi:tannase/feruloyl esterase family alpha/beta hydrolase [Novosphingobium sp. PhB165]|uniref:tannase/feruloyl esterase family alpha/beta hydrolase n=1 Tax=Novosphingobium sp. PhB165 TaxID=2485105 RepID=UPI001FB1F9F5|nr:tannase/feruloyl esterase family alpha/beta hydrolase [Novosphingobium sp. PhB165]